MKTLILASSAAIALLSVPAQAQQTQQGWYAGGLLGYVWNQDQKWSGEPGKATVVLDDGYDVSLFAGYNFGALGTAGSARAELEYSWRKSDVGKFKDNGVTIPDSSGSYTESALFVNAFYDFDQSGSVWVPFVGAGVGYGKLDYDNFKLNGNTVLDDSDSVWGYQLIAGVGYTLNPQTRLFADYRYRDWDDSNVKQPWGTKVKIENASSSLNFGVLYQF